MKPIVAPEVYLHLPLEEARKIAEERGDHLVVTNEDGKRYGIAAYYSISRICCTTENGIITEVSGRG